MEQVCGNGKLLLKFIAAERNSNWEERLAASTEMVPYDRAVNHPQYFRWGLIYLADMMNLPTFAPEVNTAFQINKHHCISRSSSKSYFYAVSTNMALEQSQIKDSKSAGGIVGISHDHESCEQWALTRHVKSFISSSFKEMFRVLDEIEFSKELTTKRIKKDEADVQSMINTITEKMVNPWEFDPENTEKDPFLNIATGLVPPPDVAKSLLTAKEQDQKATNYFIDHNLASDEKSFWTPITKMKLKTFASLGKPLKSAKSKEKQILINADRQLWNRLAIASKS